MMTVDARFGTSLRGSGIGARVIYQGREITVRVADAVTHGGCIPDDQLEKIMAARRGDRTLLMTQIRGRAAELLGRLGFTSTVFYPKHVMPALIEKANSPEDLNSWHKVASVMIERIKSRGRTVYSEFKWNAWKSIINTATTPEALTSLISQWCKTKGF